MTTKVKFEGLEQARKEFNKWQGHAVILLDFKEMTAWCDTFASGQEWVEYDSGDVFTLVTKSSLHDRNDKYNLEVLEKVAEAKYNDYKNGWADWQINDDYRYSEIFYRN